ncbi:MAG: sulfurtransferase TusA [Moraxella sp.]|nr:sulfurtransferase TusA [Moraxella sp.]
MNPANTNNITITHHLDTVGLICPEPVMLLHRTIRSANVGDVIEVLATDPASTRDVPNFCRHLGHSLLAQETLGAISHSDEGEFDSHYRYLVQKK